LHGWYIGTRAVSLDKRTTGGTNGPRQRLFAQALRGNVSVRIIMVRNMFGPRCAGPLWPDIGGLGWWGENTAVSRAGVRAPLTKNHAAPAGEKPITMKGGTVFSFPVTGGLSDAPPVAPGRPPAGRARNKIIQFGGAASQVRPVSFPGRGSSTRCMSANPRAPEFLARQPG